MRMAQRLSRVKPSATLTVAAKALELKARGRQVLSLSVGEPDFPVPPHLIEAVQQTAATGNGRYTQVPGIPEARKAVAGYYKRFYGVDAQPEATILGNGGKHVLYNIFQALLDPGDQVIIPAPYWVSYPDMVRLADGEPVIVSTKAEDDFKLLPEALEAAITPKTRALILNSPSNPTGCHYSQNELETLARLAIDKGVFVISDEVYDQLVYAPAKPSTLSRLWLEKPEQVAILGALSKTFAMPGWRLGWALAHPDLIKGMSKIQGQSTSNVCSLAQACVAVALNGSFDCVERMRQAFEKRRDLIIELVTRWPGAVCPKPEGAFYIFPDVSAFYKGDVSDSTSLCTKALEEQGVAMVPGGAFGDDRCVRISYAVKEETLIEAMDKVGKVLLS